MKMMPKFGDAIENTMASPSNPLRIGYFVRRVDRRGRRMNAGIWWEVTDGKGEFWHFDPDFCRPVETPNRQAGASLT